MGVDAVAASRAAVTTHVYCDWVPSSLAVIVGSALATIVVLSRPTKRTISRPLSGSSVSRRVMADSTATGLLARWVVLMQCPSRMTAAGRAQVPGRRSAHLPAATTGCIRQRYAESFPPSGRPASPSGRAGSPVGGRRFSHGSVGRRAGSSRPGWRGRPSDPVASLRGSEGDTSELQSRQDVVCRPLLYTNNDA